MTATNTRSYSSEYYQKNKERILKYNEDWKKRNPEYYLWHSAKQRARIDEIQFDIEITDVVIPETCPALQVKLVWKDKEYAPSLDRIDNNKGYIKGNIQVISKKANRMKNNASLEELQHFASWMMKHRPDLDDRWKNG